MSLLEQAVERIGKMEELFDHLRKCRQTDPSGFWASAQIRDELQRVRSYYEDGQWLADYRLDEQGQLPPGLKRGILSEDGLYNFLGEIEEEETQEEPGMKVYDISQEVFGCAVYPGDPTPVRQVMRSMEQGDGYNLTAFQMCAHNGTHVDAPFHFLKDGNTVERIGLERFVGMAYVAEHTGTVQAEDARNMLVQAAACHREAAKRILIKGDAVVTAEAARVFAESGVYLVGNESQSVGPEQAPAAVHQILLKADVVLLEGIRLEAVPTGVYLLSAAPLNLGGADGAPCRAVLIRLPELK